MINLSFFTEIAEVKFMNITFLGIGQVGSALARNLVNFNHHVTIAARDPNSDKVKLALSKCQALQVANVSEAIAQAEIIFLATPYDAVASAVSEIEDWSGKIVVDCTNPVGANLSHGLDSKISGGEVIQDLLPTAKVVKAFTIYGFENFENTVYPDYGNLKPAMLIAGNHPEAKQIVSNLCIELGWEPIDTGDISQSLHLEHLCLLWIKMARVQGIGPDFVWARLKR